MTVQQRRRPRVESVQSISDRNAKRFAVAQSGPRTFQCGDGTSDVGCEGCRLFEDARSSRLEHDLGDSCVEPCSIEKR